jgi:hypothetical protein
MIIAILTAGFLLALSLVLFTVGRLRPRKFKIKATAGGRHQIEAMRITAHR